MKGHPTDGSILTGSALRERLGSLASGDKDSPGLSVSVDSETPELKAARAARVAAWESGKDTAAPAKPAKKAAAAPATAPDDAEEAKPKAKAPKAAAARPKLPGGKPPEETEGVEEVEEVQETETEAAESQTEEAAPAVSIAQLLSKDSRRALAQELFDNNGEFSEETKSKFADAGADPDLLDEIRVNVTRAQQLATEAAAGQVGGPDAYSELVNYANEHLKDADLRIIAMGLASGDVEDARAAGRALKALVERHRGGPTARGQRLVRAPVGGGRAASKEIGYPDFDSYMRDWNAKDSTGKYRRDTDPAYEKLVDKKYKQSKFADIS